MKDFATLMNDRANDLEKETIQLKQEIEAHQTLYMAKKGALAELRKLLDEYKKSVEADKKSKHEGK